MGSAGAGAAVGRSTSAGCVDATTTGGAGAAAGTASATGATGGATGATGGATGARGDCRRRRGGGGAAHALDGRDDLRARRDDGLDLAIGEQRQLASGGCAGRVVHRDDELAAGQERDRDGADPRRDLGIDQRRCFGGDREQVEVDEVETVVLGERAREVGLADVAALDEDLGQAASRERGLQSGLHRGRIDEPAGHDHVAEEAIGAAVLGRRGDPCGGGQRLVRLGGGRIGGCQHLTVIGICPDICRRSSRNSSDAAGRGGCAPAGAPPSGVAGSTCASTAASRSRRRSRSSSGGRSRWARRLRATTAPVAATPARPARPTSFHDGRPIAGTGRRLARGPI